MVAYKCDTKKLHQEVSYMAGLLSHPVPFVFVSHHVPPSTPEMLAMSLQVQHQPVLWQSCFLQRMCVVRNHWCEPQLKIPKLCSGGIFAKVASLGMGWANGLGALTPVCGMELEPASDRSSLTIKAQAMLPREWEGNDPAASRHTPKNLWPGFHIPGAC